MGCNGAKGDVSYDISGLPEGVELIGNKIHVGAGAAAGDYVIRIVAKDEAAQKEKIK